MSERLTLDELTSILRAAAGDVDGGRLDAEAGGVLDVSFSELGYDSLALLETAGRIERRYGVRLDEPVVTEATTPRLLLEAANSAIAPGGVG